MELNALSHLFWSGNPVKDKQRGRRHRWGKQVDHSMGLNRRNCPTEHPEIHGQRDGDQERPECSKRLHVHHWLGEARPKSGFIIRNCCSFLGLSGCRLWANSHKFLFEGSRGHLSLCLPPVCSLLTARSVSS